MKKTFDKPWFQIASLGFLIALVLLLLFGPGTPSEADRKIVIGDADVAQLIASWQSTWNRLPTKEELSGVLQNYVREEVLYQEALKQGLDKTNAAVKRALINQMDLLAEGQGEQVEIRDEDILAYYNLRREQFMSPAVFSFRQVYFGQEAAEESLLTLKSRWNANGIGFDQARSAGTPTMLPALVENRTAPQVDREFGEGFSTRVGDLQQGIWDGPVASTFGWHLIYLDTLVPQAPLPLPAVRTKIYDQLQYEEKNAAREQFYTELIQQYDVTYKGLAKEIAND
ncbi:MAG: peptidylprolyl isomerase [Robiginitalea sp.]|nr:peptidylprolyl isomerase [Robiginitalea sp.]